MQAYGQSVIADLGRDCAGHVDAKVRRPIQIARCFSRLAVAARDQASNLYVTKSVKSKLCFRVDNGTYRSGNGFCGFDFARFAAVMVTVGVHWRIDGGGSINLRC